MTNTVTVFIHGVHYSEFQNGEIVPAYATRNLEHVQLEVTLGIDDVVYVGDDPKLQAVVATGVFDFVACRSDHSYSSVRYN